MVDLRGMVRRRMRWTFATDTGLSGTGVTDRGMEVAFKNGKDAAELAIDGALEG